MFGESGSVKSAFGGTGSWAASGRREAAVGVICFNKARPFYRNTAVDSQLVAALLRDARSSLALKHHDIYRKCNARLLVYKPTYKFMFM